MTVPVELAAMFQFMVVGITEMLFWLMCLISSVFDWNIAVNSTGTIKH
jgi:hypothetical protein